MNRPGFTAEISLVQTSEHHRILSVQDALGCHTMVFPQRIWGSVCDSQLNECIDRCYIVNLECVDSCYFDYYMCVLPPFIP